MEGSRLRILKLLQRHNRATVDWLSKEMGLASATVRRHLDILQRDQLVTFDQVKKKTGRPEYTYHLTEVGQETLPKEYDRLIVRLLNEISSISKSDSRNLDGTGVLNLAFQRMADRTLSEMSTNALTTTKHRLAAAVAFLEKEKFEPEMQETNGSVRILLHNCPYRSVALGNRAVCTYDHLVLSRILGSEAVQQGCIGANDDVCCYEVPAA